MLKYRLHPFRSYFSFAQRNISQIGISQIRFLFDKTNRRTNFSNFIFVKKLYMFRAVPLSIIRNFPTVHSALVYVIGV